MHVEADDVLHLLGEGGVLGALEGAQAMRLETVRFPDALHRPQRQAHRPGHGPAGPMGHFPRRLGAGERHDLGHDRQRHGRLARLAAAFAPEPLHPALGIMPLPPPDRRAADLRLPRHLQHRQPVGRMENDPRPLHVLQRPATVADDRGQPRTIFGGDDDRYGLGHAPDPHESSHA